MLVIRLSRISVQEEVESRTPNQSPAVPIALTVGSVTLAGLTSLHESVKRVHLGRRSPFALRR